MRVAHARHMIVLATLASLGWGVAPASAAAPVNDTVGAAIAVTTLPTTVTIDTSEATTDSDDIALNAQCGAPVTNGSVWFTYTAPAGVDGLVVDVSQSSFSAGAIIAEPDGQGGWVVDACGPGATGTPVVEGTTYTILAFSDTPGVTGGTLRASFDEAAVPTVSLSVNPRGKVDRYGNALISGSVTCADGDFLEIGTSLRQAVGRFAITGDGWVSGVACDGSTHPWSAVVVPYNGKFAGGKAASFSFAFTCGALFCADSYAEQVVRLSR